MFVFVVFVQSTMLVCFVLVASLLALGANGFVIELRSESELAEAMESYKALVVHFHSDADASSRQLAADLREASRQLLPEIQCAKADKDSEDFQNVVGVLDIMPEGVQVCLSWLVDSWA